MADWVTVGCGKSDMTTADMASSSVTPKKYSLVPDTETATRSSAALSVQATIHLRPPASTSAIIAPTHFVHPFRRMSSIWMRRRSGGLERAGRGTG